MTADVDVVDAVTVPPYDDVAERSVLGGMLLNQHVIPDVMGLVEGVDFYVPANEVIFAAVVALHEQGVAVDAVTVVDDLRRSGDLDAAGGPLAIHGLIAEVPSAVSAPFYAGIVRETAVLRRLVAAGTRIVQVGSSPGSAAEATASALAEVERVAKGLHRGAYTGISDDLDTLLDQFESGIQAAPTPWAGLNDVIGGWQPGALYVIAAATGGGKSIAGLQAVLHSALRRGVPAAINTAEMPARQLRARAISQIGMVDLGALNRGGHALGEPDWRRISEAAARLQTGGPDGGGIELLIDDRGAPTLGDVRGTHQECVRRYGSCGLLAVDYLQMMGATGRVENRQVEVSANANGLKGLAMDLHVPVLAMAQFNREHGDDRPAIRQLKDSSGIEQAADVIIMLWRPPAEEDSPDRDEDMVLAIVGKNRHGACADVELRWDARYSRLLDPAPADAVEPPAEPERERFR